MKYWLGALPPLRFLLPFHKTFFQIHNNCSYRFVCEHNSNVFAKIADILGQVVF